MQDVNQDASIPTQTRTYKKNQRKKERKRARWLAAHQGQTQGGEPKDSDIAKREVSAISTFINAAERLGDPTIAKLDASAISNDQEHQVSAVVTVTNAAERLEDPTIAKLETSAILNDQEHQVSAITTFINAAQRLGDPTIAKLDTSAISNEQERTNHLIFPKPNISAITTRLQNPKDLRNAKPHALNISDAPGRLENPFIGKPSTPAFLTAQKHRHHLDHPILAEHDVLANSNIAEHHVAIARLGVSTSTKQHGNLTYLSTFKPDLSTRAFEDTASEKSIDSDRPAKFHTPPEHNSPIQESMEGSGDEDVGGTKHRNDDSSEESVNASSEKESEDSTEEPDIYEHDPGFPVVASKPLSGGMGLKWAYATHTPTDRVLLAHNILLFEKPLTHFRWQPFVWKRKGFGIEQAPVVVETLGDTFRIPKAQFDNNVLYINTHVLPWTDIRAEHTHPDAQPPAKLVEYQAVESMGLSVWRHDRNLLNCRLLSCHAKVADYNPASEVCFGCGPKTIVRYCSEAHMVADLKEHWPECGHEDLVIKRVVDHTTTPARFGRLCPAIRNSHDNRSYALCRQGLHAILNRGRYTLFDLETEEPMVLTWTEEDSDREEIERRIERLLNLALFDQRNQIMIGMLFRLLRLGLQLKDRWSWCALYILQQQFHDEFGLDPSKVEEDRVCECEWVGEGLAEALHLPACRRLYRRFGQTFRTSGMRGYLEMYEKRYWILRAWQQQHAAVAHWRDRVAGEGFDGEVEGTSPVLGPGWMGWGAEEDDRIL